MCSYLERLEHSLKGFVIPWRGLKKRLNHRGRKRCVADLQRLRELHIRLVEWQEREVAAHSVGRRIGKLHLAESAIRHAPVGIRVAQTAQTGHVIGVPERRFKEVRRIYAGVRILYARKTKLDDRWSSPNMASRLDIRTYA